MRLTRWLCGRAATELLVAGVIALVVTAMGEQITHAYGGLEPHILHAAVLGVAGGCMAWILCRRRTRMTILLSCPLLGALIWTVSTIINLGVRGNLGSSGGLIEASIWLGAITGSLASPLPDALLAARQNPALDAYREARTLIGAWTLGCGAILMLATVSSSWLPVLTVALGWLLLASGFACDLRDVIWFRQVRFGPARIWSIVPASEHDASLPPRWSHEALAGFVVVESIFSMGGIYRTSPVLCRTCRVSDARLPRGIHRRMALTIATVVLSCLLLVASLL